MIKALIIIASIIAALFILSVIIYWFNLDMKLIRFIYPIMNKHYDNMDREKLL